MYDESLKPVEKTSSDLEILVKWFYVCPSAFLCELTASTSNINTKEMQTVRDLMLAGF